MDHLTYFAKFRETEFDDLNDDCIIEIFHNIPLHELLRLEIVCQRWKNLQELIFVRRKTKLMLMDLNTISVKNPLQEAKECFVKYDVKLLHSFHHLRVDLHKEKNAKLLLKKFPMISHLEVVYDKVSGIVNSTLMLLEAWKANLTDLKIVIYDANYNVAQSNGSWKRLFDESINQLPKLRSLMVKDGIKRAHNAPAELPLVTLGPELLSRLETLHYELNETETRTFGLFNQFGKDSNLRNFTLCNSGTSDTFTPEVVYQEVDEDFAKKLTHLSIIWRGTPENANHLRTLVNTFSSLNFLQLTVKYPFKELAPKLVKLKQLTELRLDFNNKVFPDAPIESDEPIPQVGSIQTLHLDCISQFKLEKGLIPHGEMKYVDHLFPNLATIKVHVTYHAGYQVCPTCKIADNQSCRKVFLQSLTNFDRLRRVYWLNSSGYRHWEDLLDESILARYDVIYMLNGKEMLTTQQTTNM